MSSSRQARLGRLVAAGSLLAAAGTLHSAYNVRRLRVPSSTPAELTEDVALLLPLRNEAERVIPCLQAVLAVLAQDDRLQLVVLDDSSTDGTADVVASLLHGLPRATLMTGAPLPSGWLGKPWACAQLAAATDPTTTALVFMDADVVLHEHAVRATVELMRRSRLQLVSPYPRQVAGTWSERLVQPLLQWSWLTTLPLRRAERSSRPSLTAANGQLLCVDAAAYRRAGGHDGVRAAVLDDIALLRAVKRSGGRGTVVDGTDLATCRMYTSWPELHEGYTKSLWAAFGSPVKALGAVALLLLAYVVPPVAALRGSRVGLLGYAAAVTGRALTAARTGSRVLPDACAHPVSILVLAWLTAQSYVRRRAGTLTWKGRVLP